jgi:hypothetical protein
MAGPTTRASSASGLLRIYASELRNWLGRIAKGYLIGAALAIVGALALLVAIGIGFGAAFHIIELRYGTGVAFGSIGGFFAIVAICGLLGGILLFKRHLPSPPKPYREIEDLKRSIGTRAALFLNGRDENAPANDPIMRILLGAAAVIAVGWMASGLARARAGDVGKPK